jgi:hypothetical protein
MRSEKANSETNSAVGWHFGNMGPVTTAVLEDTCGNLIQIAEKQNRRQPGILPTKHVRDWRVAMNRGISFAAALLGATVAMIFSRPEPADDPGLLAPVSIGFISRGQDVSSGPDKDKTAPGLKVFDATGTHKDKEVDYSGDRKDKPTIYVFIDSEKWDRPMARFLKNLDKAMLDEGDDAYVVAVWLTDSPDKTKEYLPIAQKSLQFQKTALTCFCGEKSGPMDWHINADAHLTAVMTPKGKVTSTLGYRSINETDVPSVLEAFKKGK